MKSKTLQEFANGINAYIKENPKHAKLPVITSRDDEGNGYNKVYYDPSHGSWEIYEDEIEGVCVS